MKKLISSVSLAVLLLVIVVAGTTAAPKMQVQPPGRLTYQGHLMDDAGDPVPDGDYVMSFSMYDDPAAGNLLWGPEPHTVDVDDGFFSVVLGTGDDPIGSDDLATTTYLEITVSGETMTPRQQLASVAFALVAGECISGSAAGAWLLSGNTGATTATLGTLDNNALILVISDTVMLTMDPVYRSIEAGTTTTATGYYATVSGGWHNDAGYFGATIGGGVDNTAGGSYATVAGGRYNETSANDAVVAGGYNNSVSGDHATVSGGHDNTASGTSAVVAGGYYNSASGMYATVVGGRNNMAIGDYSLVAGYYAVALEDGCFVWADSQASELECEDADAWIARASGGYTLYTGMSTGATLPAGSGSWASLSDRDAKTHIEPVDASAILAALAGLDVSEWSYTASPAVRHVGPMAQDFYASFGYGDSNRYISSVDADGVALAAIQALYLRVLELEARLESCRCECEEVQP